MDASSNELGEFLRARRASVDPADIGMASAASGRRVAGLRREEVAVLAGVSVDYYARLEQGRERNPSPQMVDAIGRALRLGSDARGHLSRLAGLSPTQAADPARAQVHPDLLAMLDAFPLTAAYVLGPAFDVLAENSLATALLAPFDPERNMPRILFTHPRARAIYPEWDRMARATVHALRLNLGRLSGERSIADLVEELSSTSPEFAALWADHAVEGLTRAYKVFEHPAVGRIELTYQAFDVRDAPGQQLLVGTPAPGTASARALADLSATSSTTQ